MTMKLDQIIKLSPKELMSFLSDKDKNTKLKILDLIEEKKRREREKPAHFEPNPGQRPVLLCDKLVRLVVAGNGGGKTTLAIMSALYAATGYNPIRKEYTKVPTRGIVILDKPEKVEDVWLSEFRKWFQLDKKCTLRKRGKPYVTQIIFENGSEILFMFHDQDPMSFESIEYDWAIYDEPPPRHVYIGLRRGARKKDSKPWFLIIGTPIAGSWLRKEIYDPWSRGEKPDTECFRYSTHVNQANLADDYIEQYTGILSEKEKAIRLHGEFFDLEGLALAHLFDRSHHLINPVRWPNQWPTMVVIDPHPKKAHVAILVGITDCDELVYLKEITSRRPPREFAGELREFYKGYRVVDIVCDSFGSSELTGGDGNLSFIRVLNDHGVRCRATTYNEKQDEAFIQMIQESLVIPTEPDQMGRRESQLKIVKNCKGIINDIESVEWQKYKNMDEFKPKLAIGAKDFLACLKYALAARPRFTTGREKVLRPRAKVGPFRKDRSFGSRKTS